VLISTAIGGVVMQLLLLLLVYHLETMEFHHLKTVNESYVKHLLFTIRLFVGFLFLAVIALIHGLFPFILTSTVSKQISDLNSRLKER